MSKYDTLTAYLSTRTEPEVEMTFAELDRLIGGLPASARSYPAWWANSPTAQYHAHCWLDAHRLAKPDFNAGRVRFVIGAPAVGVGRRLNDNGLTTTTRQMAQLTASGESTEATVGFEWLSAGTVELVGGRPMMPRLPEQPGIYRFTIRTAHGTAERFYVGESDNLSRRMNNYRNPGPTQPTNIRLNALLCSTLGGEGTVDVAIVLNATLAATPLDMTKRPGRLLVENIALVELETAGATVENL